MKALWFEDGAAQLRDDVTLAPGPFDETRIEVRVAGVCATDLALRRGYLGFRGVPGHEFVGMALDGPLIGQRVVGGINASCGRCADCTEGDGHHCLTRTVLGILGRPGVFAEEVLLPTRNLIAVPDTVPDESAVFAEPLAAAFEIPNQVALAPGMCGLVAGDGRLGLFCAQVLALYGVDVTLAGRHPERARLLPSSIAHVTGLLETEAADRPFDIAVEATGHPDALARVLTHVRARGTVVLKTTSEQPATLDLAPIVVDEITLVGSRCGPFAPALAALADGRIDPRGMIDARYPLDDAVTALDHAERSGVLKVLIEMGRGDF
ncbi:MAG: alcohol dehydrogenase [Planctomycetes bacterium]|nr:alcohol dehydrogenase [Planctomycetota bacterium]